MSFITKQEFQSHIYEEAQTTISRGNDQKITDSLTIGLQTITRYLSNYDTATIFATEGEEKNKYLELIMYAKDIAKWHFIAVCNVSVDLELAKERYEMAIKALEKIQRSNIIEGWPISPKNPEPSIMRSGSNKKFYHD